MGGLVLRSLSTRGCLHGFRLCLLDIAGHTEGHHALRILWLLRDHALLRRRTPPVSARNQRLPSVPVGICSCLTVCPEDSKEEASCPLRRTCNSYIGWRCDGPVCFEGDIIRI